MGNEISSMSSISCTLPRKVPTLEESLDAVCDGMEHVADRVEQVWDDATAQAPAKASCVLSDEEKLAANRWFHELMQQQDRVADGSTPCVYEDGSMALFLESVGLLSAPLADGGSLPDEAVMDGVARRGGLEGLRQMPQTEAMLSRLHSIPVGHWLIADPGRKGYYLEEWVDLVSRLRGPSLIADELTVPFDDPLSVSALLQIRDAGVLLCGCANTSPLDQMEHMLDATGAAAAASSSCRGGSIDPIGSVRPLGALLLYGWPELPDAAVPVPSRPRAGAPAAHAAAPEALATNLRAYLALTSAVTCLGYCRARRLLLVGCKSGAVQIYSPTPHWTSLQYRFALEAHVSPVARLVLLPHPRRAVEAPAASDGSVPVNDELLITVASCADRDFDPQLDVFSYDLGEQLSLLLHTPFVDPVSCLEAEAILPSASHAPARLFAGSATGALSILTLATPPAKAAPPPDNPSALAPPLDFVSVDSPAEESLVLREVQHLAEAHAARITALHHCAARSMLCSGAADGSICVWSLAAREVKGAATRLLGKLRSPQPLGPVLSLSTTPCRGGVPPRVIAAGAAGHLNEFHLRGGYVCRSLTRVPGGLSTLAVDMRADGSSLWIGRDDGTVQLWRWPVTTTAPTAESEDAPSSSSTPPLSYDGPRAALPKATAAAFTPITAALDDALQSSTTRTPNRGFVESPDIPTNGYSKGGRVEEMMNEPAPPPTGPGAFDSLDSLGPLGAAGAAYLDSNPKTKQWLNAATDALEAAGDALEDAIENSLGLGDPKLAEDLPDPTHLGGVATRGASAGGRAAVR